MSFRAHEHSRSGFCKLLSSYIRASHTEARFSSSRTAYKRLRNGVTPAASPRTRRTIDVLQLLVKDYPIYTAYNGNFGLLPKLSSSWLLILPWAQNKAHPVVPVELKPLYKVHEVACKWTANGRSPCKRRFSRCLVLFVPKFLVSFYGNIDNSW